MTDENVKTDGFPSYQDFQEWLGEFADELPEPFFDQLNLGIVLAEEALTHEQSRPGQPLYILGQYRRRRIGAQILIFYGSFKTVYRYSSREAIREQLRKTLRHEFRHHIETRAGVKDLIREDEERLAKYNRNFMPEED